MRQITKDSLMQVLKEDAPFWTNNTMYTQEAREVPSYVHLQSRGDILPDVSKGGKVQPGWMVILQLSNPSADCAICRDDNGTADQITSAFMGITTTQNIATLSWTQDLRESFGYIQRYEVLRDSKLIPYTKVMFSRPPGHMLPDKSP